MKLQVLKQSLLLLCWSLLVCYYLNHGAYGMCIDQEREALLKFKGGFRQDKCGLLSSWSDHVDNKDCCQWHGIECSNNTDHVIKLNLRGTNTDLGESENCLHGKVSSSLVDLKNLRYLDLSLNFFDYAPIPSFIGSLSKLEHLDLSHSFFGGDVPHQLGNLSRLTFLDLGFMLFDEYDKTMGGISGSLLVEKLSWLSQLTMLRHVDLSTADLSKATDWLQIVNKLPYLEILRLDFCQLPSIVPWPLSYINSSTTLSVLSLSNNDLNDSSIFQWLFNLSGINTHLTHLDLSKNQLPGPLPSSFGNLQALSYLDLSNNYFDGTIPSLFEKLQSLSYLSLTQNQFHGQIPNFIAKNLTYLDLSSNKFQVWPKTFNALCSLQELYLNFNNLAEELSTIIQALIGCANSTLSILHLGNNQIWGSIPSNIEALSSLSMLDLGGNKLNGTISQSLGQLSTLNNLNLSSNSLKGPLLTIHLSNLSELIHLDLSYNPELKFEATPPSQILSTIRLRSCKLGPSFPKWLLTQTYYMELDVSSSGLSDRIPESFWNSLPPQLNSLNMSHNNIYGRLPDLHQDYSFKPFPFEIDLSFNSFEGTMPSSYPDTITSFLLNDNKFSDPKFFLCPKNVSSLTNLDLSNNLLSGELPDCWMNFSYLTILHLANNSFSGAIPPSIGYLNQLQALHLRNNKFSEVPRSLYNLTSLVILDLAHNSLRGLIPPNIGNSLGSLSFLSLRNNHFVGEIPSSLCQLSFLQILDLSANHITGTIPKCMYNLTAMKNGTDLLPKLQYNIHKYSIDSYSFNYYTDAATIMWKRKEWSFMNSLGLVKQIDMSDNQLYGEIPDSIFSLSGLVSLDLSNNNLSGTITTKIGQLKALEFLDLSSNHLSGEIPRSLADLNSLGILDLSYNHLSGKIPTGTLLQGFDTLAYAGNPNLCGIPLPKCPWDHPPDRNGDNIGYKDDNGSEDIYPWLYISVVLGFIIGFWGVCGSLVLKRSWRHNFFRFFDDSIHKLHMAISVTVARVRRKL